MFDFSWGDGGLTVYWPNSNPYPTSTYPGSQYPGGYIPPTSQTQISTGTLVLLALLAYLILKK